MARPSKYKPEFASRAKLLAERGATDREIAAALGVGESTLYDWKLLFPEFSESIKTGKDPADDRVEMSLYRRATGYTFSSEKVFQFQGAIVRADTDEHVPPDVTAAIFWLKNRRPKKWRDIKATEISGPDGSSGITVILNKP